MRVGAARLELKATTLEGALGYFQHRAVQGLMEGWAWSGQVWPLALGGEVVGARTVSVASDGAAHQSIYVLDQHTGRGVFGRSLARWPLPIVTAPDCGIEGFLAERGVPFRVAGAFTTCREYRAVAAALDRAWAQRAGVHYMNHIDEGLAVLAGIGAGEAAMRAFCLHPLVQSDEALASWAGRLHEATGDVRVAALAMEYRSVANAWLSTRAVSDDEARAMPLGPLVEVADMLRADKIQNYKDFLRFHAATHPRREALDAYFRRWLGRLGVTDAAFAAWQARLTVPAACVQEATPLDG